MGEHIAFSCHCGQIHGVLDDISPKAGLGLVCFCDQCRASEVYLDQEDPEDNGVAIFQTTADRVRFAAGNDQMYAFSYSKGGLIRWYAKCCKAPLFNTTATPQSGFVGVLVNRLDNKAPLGPIRAMIYRKNEQGKQVHQGLSQVIKAGLSRSARMRLSGRWKKSPFFGKSGAPISRVHVLSDVEKKHLPLPR